MKIIGKVTREHLGEMARRGIDPKAAVDQTLAEAKRRYPGSCVVFQKRGDGSGFDLVAL